MIYVAIAYRWGRTNAHQYVVTAGKRNAVIAAARLECADRGGKYGVAVYRIGEDGPVHPCEEYFASTYDEKAPAICWRMEMFNDLGHDLYNWFNGTRWVTAKGIAGGRILKPRKCSIKKWMRDSVVERERMAETMEGLANAKTKV